MPGRDNVANMHDEMRRWWRSFTRFLMHGRIILGTNGHLIPPHLVEGCTMRGRFVNDVTYVRSARISLQLQIWIIRCSGCRWGDFGKKYLGRETFCVCTCARLRLVSRTTNASVFLNVENFATRIRNVSSRKNILHSDEILCTRGLETNYLLGVFPQITFPANCINYLSDVSRFIPLR